MQLWRHHLLDLRPQSAQGLSVFRVLDGMGAASRSLPWRWGPNSWFTKRRSWSPPPRGHYTQLACSSKLILGGGKWGGGWVWGGRACLDNQSAHLTNSAVVIITVELWCFEALKAFLQRLKHAVLMLPGVSPEQPRTGNLLRIFKTLDWRVNLLFQLKQRMSP